MQNEETQAVDLENNLDIPVEQTATETVEDTTDYKSEALKWKAIAQRNAKKPITNETTVKPSEVKPSDILESDEFALYREGYTNDDIKLIMRNGGRKIFEDKKNPLVLGLQAAKEQRGAEDAASKVSDSTGLSDIERKYTEQDMRNMTKEELAKLLPHTNN